MALTSTDIDRIAKLARLELLPAESERMLSQINDFFDVVETMRTCHGECQLSKRFNALEQESQKEFPVERISVRLEPQVPVAHAPALLLFSVEERLFPDLDAAVSTGFPPTSEPVPWLS